VVSPAPASGTQRTLAVAAAMAEASLIVEAEAEAELPGLREPAQPAGQIPHHLVEVEVEVQTMEVSVTMLRVEPGPPADIIASGLAAAIQVLQAQMAVEEGVALQVVPGLLISSGLLRWAERLAQARVAVAVAVERGLVSQVGLLVVMVAVAVVVVMDLRSMDRAVQVAKA
jgi:hypothetical protein